MEKTTPNILIIGGGMAGMAAARSLADQDVSVHLVEKEPRLGGHAAGWACMATDTCKNCGACLSIEMADQVLKQKNAISHLNTQVVSVQKNDPGYDVTLEDKTSFSVEKIILAAGFTPFDPALTPSFHHAAYPNVVTTAELNTLLKEETLSRLLDNKTDPKIAFIQCVGSRNRDQGRDYCSQVCCRISLRHANKLTHLYPNAAITVFYMDLQIIGKEIRPLFNEMSKNIVLVQGVPAEILENPETRMLTLVTEDKETRSRVSKAFDLIVLSVGMQPFQSLEATSGMLGLTPNTWGFFNTDAAALSKDVITAGCADSPKDILSAQQDGRIAAAKIIEDLGLNVREKKTIAVFGNGSAADQAAQAIASKGFPTCLFGPGTRLPDNTPVTVLKDSALICLSGTAGNFSLYVESQNRKQTIACGAIIAALEPAVSANRLEDLKNMPTRLDDFSAMLDTTPDKCPENSVFLLDYFGPEDKVSARLALTAAMQATSLGKSSAVIMNTMLVHGALGQRLYDTARKQGVTFFRFDTCSDLDIQDSGTGFLLKLKESTLPSLELNLPCDCLVLPTAKTPAKGFKEIARHLGQPLDAEGYLQSANTRHRLTQSPRKGIFYAGPGHDEVDMADVTHELDEILSALATQSFDLPHIETGVEINQKKCAQCLTCIRICPHAAIVMNDKDKPQIVPDACFSCHLCVSNCPAYAIESAGFANADFAGRIQKDTLTIFACERSAALAAGSLALPDHVDLIPIPCACRISSDVILKALLNGASKVIVAGCHTENCRSLEGGKVAAASVKKVLRIPGMEPSKVIWEPVAANETVKFERMMSKAKE